MTAPRFAASYTDAAAALPSNAEWSSSFGNPGEGGYVEYWREPNGGDVWTIGNGAYDAWPPFVWRVATNPKRPA